MKFESFSEHKVFKAIVLYWVGIGQFYLNLRDWVPLSSHMKTTSWLRSRVYWLGIDLVTELYVRGCVECQITDSSKSLVGTKQTELPTGPWQAVAFDGPLPRGDQILPVLDNYSIHVWSGIWGLSQWRKQLGPLMTYSLLVSSREILVLTMGGAVAGKVTWVMCITG